MTLKQRNLLIAVLAIILIAGGIFYYNNRNREVPSNDLTTEPPGNPNETPSGPPLTGGGGETVEESAQNKEKWNTAMKNAGIAFGKGDYDRAITFYNEALSYYKTDEPYSGLFLAYSAQNNAEQARIAIEAAIKLNPLFVEHWKSKLSLLDEKTNVSFADLKKIYQEGILKVDPRTKVNLVVYFAAMAERNGEKAEAIALWEYAKELYPQNTLIYQAQIDRLVAS